MRSKLVKIKRSILVNFILTLSNKKAITRLYRPVISEAQYVNSFIGEDTRAKISAYFVEHTDDLEMIEQLKKLIQEKEKELK